MTDIAKTYVKDNWLTLANFMLLLGLAFQTGSFTQEVRESIKINKDNIRELKVDAIVHSTDATLHSPFEKNATLFVPRTEIDVRLKNIEANQEKISAQQDKIYNKLMNIK